MNMLRTIKRFWWLALLVVGVPAAWGYALLGPVGNGGDSWQTQSLGYNPQPTLGDGQSTAPKNIGEGYRQNKGAIYYAYDASFLGFFGTDSNGVEPIDQAFAILNAVFTNNPTGLNNGLDGYSSSLQEFPLNSQHVNYTAYTLGLMDMKSVTLWALVEQMGLAWPERYVWDLHQAYLPTGGNPPPACPLDEEYEVVMRNYPVEDSQSTTNTLYSPYVNDTLYSFYIFYWPNCQRPAGSRAQYDYLAVPFPVDPFADGFTSVAGGGVGNMVPGGFYTGLTRDDAAGLRYLLTSRNRNMESVASGAVLLATNFGTASPQLTTSNLNALLVFAKTNDPSLIPGTFPNVVVASAVTNWVLVTNWSIGSYLYTPNGAPYGTQILVVYSNIVGTAWQPVYQDTFANVITNVINPTNYPGIYLTGGNIVLNYSPNTPATIQTVQISQPPGSPYGTLTTNTTVQNIVIHNMPSGEYISIPSSQCGWKILNYPPTWSVVAITNVIAQATNTYSTGNGTSNTFVGSQSIVTYFTNHTYLVQPVNCSQSTPGAGLYGGVQKIQFVRANFDSLIGQFFRPVTNTYTMTLITNSQAVVQSFQRVVTQPDIVLSANDEPLTSQLPTYSAFSRSIAFDQGNILPNLAGPGTITSPATFTYNKAGNLYINSGLADTNHYLGELDQSLYGVIWASYDDTTNPPVVYPNGSSLQNLVNQMLIQVTPAPGILPDGTNGVAYTNITFSATGGAFSPPYTWAVAPGSQPLPQGLSLTTANSIGTLSGTPQSNPAGTFDFTIQLTDSLGRSVTWNYTIKIH